jgi:hypothetical protein
MPYAQRTCEYCGRPYKPYPVEEVERWLRKNAAAQLASDPTHFQRYVKIAEALCPACRESKRGRTYRPSPIGCTVCGSWGRDRRGNCRVCGCPPGAVVSREFIGRGGGGADVSPNPRQKRKNDDKWNAATEAKFKTEDPLGLADVGAEGKSQHSEPVDSPQPEDEANEWDMSDKDEERVGSKGRLDSDD